MARYKGPVCKLCRREGQKLFLKGEKCYTEKCPVVSKGSPPGQQNSRFKGSKTDYGVRLREKQKVKRMYGLLERQFKNYFEKAQQEKGKTGENLLRRLELRLDNVVFRLGLSPSRAAGRQLSNHGHFKVNGELTSSPSYLLSPGDAVKVKESSKTLNVIHESLGKQGSSETVPWLELDKPKLEGKVINLPTRQDIPVDVQENLIVEFYSR